MKNVYKPFASYDIRKVDDREIKIITFVIYTRVVLKVLLQSLKFNIPVIIYTLYCLFLIKFPRENTLFCNFLLKFWPKKSVCYTRMRCFTFYFILFSTNDVPDDVKSFQKIYTFAYDMEMPKSVHYSKSHNFTIFQPIFIKFAWKCLEFPLFEYFIKKNKIWRMFLFLKVALYR